MKSSSVNNLRLCQPRSQGGERWGERGGERWSERGGEGGQRGGEGGGAREGGEGATAYVDRKVQKRRCNAKDDVRTTLSATFQVPPVQDCCPPPERKSWLHNCLFKKI